MSNKVVTVQAYHEVRGDRKAKQSAPLLRASGLIFKTAKSRTQGGPQSPFPEGLDLWFLFS